jgi:hypothetical protein
VDDHELAIPARALLVADRFHAPRDSQRSKL